jgi:hypothetical protein
MSFSMATVRLMGLVTDRTLKNSGMMMAASRSGVKRAFVMFLSVDDTKTNERD